MKVVYVQIFNTLKTWPSKMCCCLLYM
jgi:hypothetical protein